ncbi:sensor histidine kinase [Nitratifractor salsuginis]|uniref:histidine kinase n=1 Tax=Nitratifractor salsuginis (strain DSM 16511 / JCM 12458 / E9I37-1) TaxID=749222 RepID=E6X0V2_NITSE|nr:ATP-binding protein [Nitratifractor salsuginis]ADV46884.1 integral membrane sensor signal transduction histidine kinase [Nitratifractor salsuginis DSM 16511]
MLKRKTFRSDIRQKMIALSLIPMIIIGLLGSLLIYRAEVSLQRSEHTRLLNVVERLSGEYYRRVHLLFNVIQHKIVEEDEASIKNAFDYAPELVSIIEIDNQGKIRRIYARDQLISQPHALDPHLKRLLEQVRSNPDAQNETVYYSKTQESVLLAYAFRFRDHFYIIQVDPKHFFEQLKYLLQKKELRSIAIIDDKGDYIYSTRDENLSRNTVSFYKDGAYAAAVKNSDPYTVTEFPEHYREGDSFWKGWFDEDNFLSYAHLPDFNWMVVVRDHRDQLDKYLQKILLVGSFLMVLILLVTIISARMMSNRIVKPVEQIIQRINLFAMGSKDFPAMDREKTYPIFENLIESFETMRRKIRAREQKLKAQIQSNDLMQKRLVQQEKMAAMGEMIGNIAHQWRQPLSVISTLATGMKTEKELGILNDKGLINSCTQINNNVQYLSETIEDFRQFIRGDHEKETFDAEELIESLKSLLNVQLKRHEITLETFIEPGLKILGYRNDLLQVLINLVNNAKDAFLEKGEEDRYIAVRMERTEKGAVLIRVLDNGGGIDDAILHRIFEPYFTTKDKSQGTGLGLHMTYRLIVEGMGGTIQARTVTFTYHDRQVKGAEFTIILPEDETSEAPKSA